MIFGYQRCPAAVDAPALEPTSAFGVLAGAHHRGFEQAIASRDFLACP
jgi:hypothetical protein